VARRPLEREGINLDRGRRTTQLMRDSLGRTLMEPRVQLPDRPNWLGAHLGHRMLIALCVATVTYFSWATLFVLGSVGSSLGDLFSATHHSSAALTFGAIWLWVVGALGIAVVGALLTASRHLRLLAVLWFLAISVLAVNATLMPGQFEPRSTPLIPVIAAAGLLAWINVATRRAA
jgi:hypothetical protein